MMDDIERAMLEMYGVSSIPQTDLEEYMVRTTEVEHSPDCDCTICQYEEGFSRIWF